MFSSFGIGVLLANYFGNSQQKISWSIQLQELFKVPTLLVFLIVFCSRRIDFYTAISWGLRVAVLLAIGSAFLLAEIQVKTIKKSNCFDWAVILPLLKML